tara:strand:+ start:17095 stop:17724 length:630 start_codon:yes stop_codon:yes gene_type:complete
MRIIELNINDVSSRYNLPTTWSEVTLEQYSKLMLLLDDEDSSEVNTIIKTLETLLGIDGTTLIKVPLKQLKKVYVELGALTSTLPKNELTRVIDVDGTAYGFIPDFDNLTFAEFVDLDTYLQDAWNNLDKIITVLYRKITKIDGDKYNIEAYDVDATRKRRDIFNKGLSIDTVYGAIVFFYHIGSKFIETMEYSLIEENIKLQKMKEKI